MKLGLLVILVSGFMSNAYGYGILGTNFGAPTIDGKDNIFAPNTGDIVYDASDATFYGRTHSSSWIAFGGAAAATPVGTVITFAGTVCPTGYLAANGSAEDRTTYADLFEVIGISHGEGDGSTTFNLPDYRGRFLRGVDGTAGNDPDKALRTAMNPGGNVDNNVGSVQGDQLASHSHFMARGNGTHSYGSGGVVSGIWDQPTTATGGNETRPKNAYVNFCIKH